MSDSEERDWEIIKKDLTDRLCRFFRPLFLVYSILFVFCGSAGVWLPYAFGDASKLLDANSLFTYSIAIISALATDYVLLDRTDYETKVMSMISLLVMAPASFLLLYGYVKRTAGENSLSSFIGTIMVLTVWLFAYVKDQKFDKKKSNYSPLGGATPNPSNLRGA